MAATGAELLIHQLDLPLLQKYLNFWFTSSLDLFALWALVLLALGMARVAGSSRLRAGLVVAVLWSAQVAFLKLAPAAMAAGPRGGA